MNCDICGRPAHFHSIFESGGVRTESHLCEEHSCSGDLSQQALEDFATFVESHRRMPTIDELRAIGAVGLILPHLNAPEFIERMAELEDIAELLLSRDEEKKL
jgi:hypothetical protein